MGSYLKLCKLHGFFKAAIYFEEKIKDSTHGESEEIIATEDQMMHLIKSLETKEN